MTMPVPSTLSSPLSADMIIDAKTGKPRQKYLYEALSTDQDAHWKDQEFVKAEFEAESFKVKFFRRLTHFAGVIEPFDEATYKTALREHGDSDCIGRHFIPDATKHSVRVLQGGEALPFDMYDIIKDVHLLDHVVVLLNNDLVLRDAPQISRLLGPTRYLRAVPSTGLPPAHWYRRPVLG